MDEHSESLVRVDTRPTYAALRSFGMAVATASFARALWDWAACSWSLPPSALTTTASCGALIALMLAWLKPRIYYIPYVLLSLLTYPLRCVVALFLLAVLYFAVITPIAWGVRVTRRDATRRDPDKTGTGTGNSAWIESRPRAAKTDYFRQF